MNNIKRHLKNLSRSIKELKNKRNKTATENAFLSQKQSNYRHLHLAYLIYKGKLSIQKFENNYDDFCADILTLGIEVKPTKYSLYDYQRQPSKQHIATYLEGIEND